MDERKEKIEYPEIEKPKDGFINNYAERSEFMRIIKNSYFSAMLKKPPKKDEKTRSNFSNLKKDENTDFAFKGFYMGLNKPSDDVYYQSAATYMLLSIINGEDVREKVGTNKTTKKKTQASGDSKVVKFEKYEQQAILGNIDWLMRKYEGGEHGLGDGESSHLTESDRKHCASYDEYKRHTATLTYTQMLLTFVQALLAHEAGKIDGGFERLGAAEDGGDFRIFNFKGRINTIIDDCLCKINDEFIKAVSPGKWSGWTFGKKETVKYPSLFFTYAVLEAFSEVEEIFTDKKSVLNGRIKEFSFSDNYQKLVDNVRLSGYTLWREYKDSLAKGFFSEKGEEFSISDIVDKGVDNAHFNTLFVILSVIYSSVNRILRVDKDFYPLDKLKDTLSVASLDSDIASYANLIQSAMPRFDALRRESVAKGKEFKIQDYIVEIEHEWLTEDAAKDEAVLRDIRETNVFDKLIGASLVPLLTRANNLFALYISRYPKKEISEYFNRLTKSRISVSSVCYHYEKAEKNLSYYEEYIVDKETGKQKADWKAFIQDNSKDMYWLWGAADSFDTQAGAKAINAVIDFYEYYETYEQPFIEPSKNLADTRDAAEIKIAELEKTHKIELAEKEKENAAALKAERENRPLENAVKRLVEEVFDDKLPQIKEVALKAIRETIVQALAQTLFERSGDTRVTLSEIEKGIGEIGEMTMAKLLRGIVVTTTIPKTTYKLKSETNDLSKTIDKLIKDQAKNNERILSQQIKE